MTTKPSQQSRKLPLILTSIVLTTGMMALTGCGGTGSDTGSPSDTSVGIIEETPETPGDLEQGVILEITEEQEKFRENLIANKTDLETAQQEIEANNYTWRIGEQDGEQYALTMDYRVDRLTLVVNDNIVTDATWG